MSRRTWQWIAGLIAATFLAAAFASPAAANVSNVVPLNGQQEPIAGDVITDDEELWAYVTSAFGGVVCIHRASEAPAGCKDEVDTYAETPIAPFTAGFVPIQAGRLRSGDWILVGATAAGAPATAVSAPFTVRPCPECPPADFSKNNDFRIAAQALITSINTTCSLMKAASMLWRAKGVYTFAQVAIGGLGSGLGVGAVMVTVASGAEAVYDVVEGDDLTVKLPGALGTIADGICNAAEKVQKFQESTLGHWVGAWAADPPDPAFTQVTPPPFTDYDAIAGMPDWGFNAQRSSLDHIRAYAESSLHAYERYQGADQAGSAPHEHAQTRAMGEDLLGFAQTLRSGAAFVADAAGQMRAEFPDAADRTVTQADIDAAQAYVARLKATGYTAGERDQLHAIGLSDDAIARLKVDQTLYEPADAGPGVLDEHFDTLATRMRETADVAEDFAAEAWTFAGRSDVPPTAGFTEGPHSGPGERTIAFTDITANPDLDPLALTWDFGDGSSTTSAAGVTVSHAYAGAGPYTVTLTVSDDYGSDTASRSVSPGPPNQEPTAAFTATPSSGDAPLDVELDASGSSDPDGTIESYAWEFGDLSSGSGKVTSRTYAAPGTYTVRLTVTDDRGATATVQDAITVTKAPEPPVAADDVLEVAPTGVVDVLANDVDGDGELLTVAASTPAAHGTVSCAELGACTYTADAGYLGADSFTYTVRDASGTEDTGSVAVTVGEPPPVAVPVARADEVATRRGVPATFNVLANDAGTGIEVTDTTDPGHGTASCTAAGACSYAPAAGFSGADGFRYTIEDDEGHESDAEVHVTVAPADAAFGVGVAGGPGPIASGAATDWGVDVAGVPAGAGDDALAALPLPSVTATLAGAHAIEPGSLKTARGWTAGAVTEQSATATAGAGALLGEADTQLIAKPLPPTSQGAGGDGYVPILVGSRVFAFFHHTHPTSVTCIDRATGSRCPGYPIATNMSTNDFPGHGAVVGSRIYVHIDAAASYPHTAPMGLYCWDTATARPCGYVVVRRFVSNGNPGGSSPVLVGGKLYFGGDGGRLYCVDPSTNQPCASIPTGLPPELGGVYDIVSHGTRVYLLRAREKLACVDVSTAGPCNGWATPLTVEFWGENVVNRFSAAGVANGVCVVTGSLGNCYLDAGPAPVTPIEWLPVTFWGVDTEAETGTRTLVGHGGYGLYCWDWTTLAPCAGNGYDSTGLIATDVLGNQIPQAYGAAYDGSCVVGLGDPGLVFSVDPVGVSPCSSLPESRTIDLRDQRCDGAVGAATWQLASLQAAGAGELTAVQLTVRDAATDQVLATKDLTTGDLDLRGIDAKAHPAITITALARSAPGDAAWADAVPPRIRITWDGDARQLCFRTRTRASCAVAPVSVTAAAGPATKTAQVPLTPTGCPVVEQTPTPGPTGTPTPEPVRRPVDAADLVLGCSDRRVVLEDVFIEGGRVRLLGVAARELAGRSVQLVFAATGKVVATARLGADGRFAAAAPLPPKKLRTSDKARYVAKVGGESSLTLKLVRRMLVTRVTSAADRVTITGRVVPPLATGRKDRAITVQRVVACKSVETVATAQPKKSGAFSVTVRAPAGQRAAVYRLMTKVRTSTRSKALARTFTLPRAVDFR